MVASGNEVVAVQASCVDSEAAGLGQRSPGLQQLHTINSCDYSAKISEYVHAAKLLTSF